jgi:hypothetical protein
VTRELANVDVHSARVLAAKGRERRRMDGDRSHAPNRVCLVSVDRRPGEVIVLHRGYNLPARRRLIAISQTFGSVRSRDRYERAKARSALGPANAIIGEATTKMIAKNWTLVASCQLPVVSDGELSGRRLCEARESSSFLTTGNWQLRQGRSGARRPYVPSRRR